LKRRQSLGEDVHVLERGLHSLHLDLALFQVIMEPVVIIAIDLEWGVIRGGSAVARTKQEW
jgi:hypothetical protein